MERRAKGRGVRGAIASALLGSLLVSSCTVTERQLVSQSNRSDELQLKIQRLEQAIAELQRAPKPKDPGADQAKRLDRLGKDLGDLRARVDGLEEQSRRIADLDQRAEQVRREATRETARIEDDLTKQLAGLSKQVTELAKKVKDVEGRLQARLAEASTAGGSGGGERSPSEKKPTAQALYDEGYALYKDRRYEGAREKFREYIRLYPDTPLTDNAQFWIGETYYYQAQSEKDPGQYERAILEYDKVLQQYPKGDKVPSALLKQALAFKAIDDPADARILLRKILRDHPASDPAKIAENELKAMGD